MNSQLSIACRIGCIALSLLTTRVISSYYGIEGLSTYALLMSGATVATVLDFGLTKACLSQIPALVGRRNSNQLLILFIVVISVSFVFSIALLALINYFPIRHLLSHSQFHVALLCILLIAVIPFYAFSHLWLSRSGKSIPHFFATIASAALVPFSIILLKHGFDMSSIRTLVCAILISWIPYIASSLLLFYKNNYAHLLNSIHFYGRALSTGQISLLKSFKIKDTEVRNIASLWCSSILSTFAFSIDNLYLIGNVSDYDIALYSLTQKLFLMPMTLVSAFLLVKEPLMALAYSENKLDFFQIQSKVARTLLTHSIAMAPILVLVSPVYLSWVSHEKVAPLPSLVVGFMSIYFLNHVYGFYCLLLTATLSAHVLAYATALNCTSNIVLSLLLTHRFGIYGPILGSITGYILGIALMHHPVKGRLKRITCGN